MAVVRPMAGVFEYEGTIVVNPTSRRSNGHPVFLGNILSVGADAPDGELGAAIREGWRGCLEVAEEDVPAKKVSSEHHPMKAFRVKTLKELNLHGRRVGTAVLDDGTIRVKPVRWVGGKLGIKGHAEDAIELPPEVDDAELGRVVREALHMFDHEFPGASDEPAGALMGEVVDPVVAPEMAPGAAGLVEVFRELGVYSELSEEDREDRFAECLAGGFCVPVDDDDDVPCDGEEIDEGGVLEFVDGVRERLEALGSSLPEANFDGDGRLVVGAHRFVIWPDDEPDWGRTTLRVVGAVNHVLVAAGDVHRVAVANAGGNDGIAWVLRGEVAAAIVASGVMDGELMVPPPIPTAPAS